MFFRKFFRGDDSDPTGASPADAPTERPKPDAPTPLDAPAEDGAAAPAPDTTLEQADRDVEPARAVDWWASSDPEGVAPPNSQSATVRHEGAEADPPAGAPGETGDAAEEPAPPSDEEETAPYSLAEIEQAKARMAAEQAAGEAARATTPPAGVPAVGADALEGTRQLDEDSAPSISSARSAQGLAAMAMRDIGRVREVNQDSVFSMITTLPRESSDLPVGLFIVADGMGGHHGGEVASRLAVRTVVYHVLSQLVLPALDDTLEMSLQAMMVAAVQSANETIWDYAQSQGSDMGTTCTAALLVGQGIYLAHVGDSRAYLLEPGGLRQISSDHSTVGRLIQLGQLDPSEAREHPLRNQLYRTVGQTPQIQVDFVYQSVGAASHLLLCSDGLWGMVEDRLIEQALTRSPWPQDACHELIALANLAGGDDNISAVAVTLPIAER